MSRTVPKLYLSNSFITGIKITGIAMKNHLKHETSPYLLQHVNNPVDWYPWGDEALDKAKAEDKPIFLSIGYAACHWCHVMAHETFDDPGIAEILNEKFINIKVDREERPDIDNIYMTAVVALTGQGGWPMSVFLTPERQPFFAGTYFPPVRKYNIPSFREVIQSVNHLWKVDRAKILESSENITNYLKRSESHPNQSYELDPKSLDIATSQLGKLYDWNYGGWGSAPKFPQPMVIEFLLRRSVDGDSDALNMSIHALENMARGGMYDVVAGGFSRYSTDNNWLIPHFEKMLYDNAQLALVYLHAYLLTDNPRFRLICEETLNFILREMTDPSGGFYSSLDADSEGREGQYYIWTIDDITKALDGNQENIDLALTIYGVSQAGNFEGANVLQRKLEDKQIADKFGLLPHKVQSHIQEINSRLLVYREKRLRPGTDDKILTSWNALALVAFSEAARYLNNNDYKIVAMRNAKFILESLFVEERLMRSWRNGQAKYYAYLEDYASLALGMLSLYQTDPDEIWFNSSIQLIDTIIDHFRDSQFGFYDTHEDQDNLIIRPKDTQDNATPSGNALASLALLQLSTYTGNDKYREIAEKSLKAMANSAQKYPTAFGYWLCAIQYALSSIREIALIGYDYNPLTQALSDTIWSTFRPNIVLAQSDPDKITSQSPFLLQNRSLIDGKSTAYVCEQFVCKKPVTTPADLISLLENPS